MALSNIMRLPIAGIIRMLARELKPYGITFKGVLPSIVLTNHVKQLTEDRVRRECKTPEQVLNEWARDVPLKRLGKPEELGWLVAFLASEKASFINGAVIPLDGGFLRSIL